MMSFLSLAKCSEGPERGGAMAEKTITESFASETPKLNTIRYNLKPAGLHV